MLSSACNVSHLFSGAKKDILFQHTNGDLSVWYMDGVDLLSPAYLNPSAPGDPAWRVRGAGDFNSDGKLDIIFQNTNNRLMCVWYMNGANMTSTNLISPSDPGVGWSLKGTGDFNQDGKPDLVFQHDSGYLAAWYMNGITMTAGYMINPDNPGTGWTLRTTGDLNKDGKTDLIFQHTTGYLAAWFLDGVNQIYDDLLNPNSVASGWQVMAAGSFDSDQDADGLTFGQELRVETDPGVADTDGDGISDGKEDKDSDGFTNREEFAKRGTDPINPNTLSPSVPDAIALTAALQETNTTELRLQVTSGDPVLVKIIGTKAGTNYVIYTKEHVNDYWKVEATVVGLADETTNYVSMNGRNLLLFVGGVGYGTDTNALPDSYEAIVTKTAIGDDDSDSLRDYDGDGLFDHPGRGNNGVPDHLEDFDGDELTNAEEFELKRDSRTADSLLPKKLMVYYGWPSSIRNETNTPALAEPETEFARYSYVVLGAGLELTSHPDHTAAKNIISNAHRINPNTKFFGYITIRSREGQTYESLTNSLNLWTAFSDSSTILLTQDATTQTAATTQTNKGLEGIFIDDFEFGFMDNPPSNFSGAWDNFERRKRMNAVVNYAHTNNGFRVIANGYQPDHIFKEEFGPASEIKLRTNDFYFHEHHQIKYSDYVADPISEWSNKVHVAWSYQETFKFKLLSLTSQPTNSPVSGWDATAPDEFNYAWHSALLYGHEATGWGEVNYSANGTFNAVAPFRPRPGLRDAGRFFGDDPIPGEYPSDGPVLEVIVSGSATNYIGTRRTYWNTNKLGTITINTQQKTNAFTIP